MVNVMYALTKLGNMAEVLSLYDLAPASVLKVDDVSLRLDMRAKLLFNCQTAHLRRENLTEALKSHDEVREGRALFGLGETDLERGLLVLRLGAPLQTIQSMIPTYQSAGSEWISMAYEKPEMIS